MGILYSQLCVTLHSFSHSSSAILYFLRSWFASAARTCVLLHSPHVTSSELTWKIYLQDGERGYLEGLASRYADLFSTHYGDVLGHLEDLRRIEWAESSPRERSAITPGTPPANYSPVGGTPVSSGHGLTSSQSQPIYVPGKYSVGNAIFSSDF